MEGWKLYDKRSKTKEIEKVLRRGRKKERKEKEKK